METTHLTRGHQMHNPGVQPRRLLGDGGAYPRSSAACLPSSDTTESPTLGFAPSGEAQVRAVGLGRRGSDQRWATEDTTGGAGGRKSALEGARSWEDRDSGGERPDRSPHSQGGAMGPSPIEATFRGKRGVPAQPLLAASAAPQLAGKPAPEEGPAPPHLLAASLPLPFPSSGRAPPPPSSSILPPPGL